MHGGYDPTSKWYLDFWSGITDTFETLWGAFGHFVKVSEWDWEAIGFLTGVLIAALALAGVLVGFVAVLHLLGVF